MRIPFPDEARAIGIEPTAENLRELKMPRLHQAYRGDRTPKACAECRRDGVPAEKCRHRSNGQKRYYLTNVVAIGLDRGLHGQYEKGRLKPVSRSRIAAINGLCESSVSRQMSEVSAAGALRRRRGNFAEANRYNFAIGDGDRKAWCVVDRTTDKTISHSFSEAKARKAARFQNVQHRSTDRFFVEWRALPADEYHAPTLAELRANPQVARLYDDLETWKTHGTTPTLDGYAHIPRWLLLLVDRPAYKAVLEVYLLRGLLQLHGSRIKDRLERIPQDQVAYAAGVSVRTVRRANDALEKTGLFRVVAHRGAQQLADGSWQSEPQTIVYLPLEKADKAAAAVRRRVDRIRARIGAQAVEFRKALARVLDAAGLAQAADMTSLEASFAVFRRYAEVENIPEPIITEVLAPPG